MEINYEKYIKCIKTQCELDKNEWTFKNNKDFNEILEHLTKKEGIEYLKFISIKFFFN